MRELPIDELVEKVKPFLDFEIDDEDVLKKAIKLAAERMKFFGEAREFLHYFFGEIDPPVELFENPKMKVDRATAAEALAESLPILEAVENWTAEEIQKSLLELVTKLEWKNGQLLWPLRVALSGEKFSPGVWEMAEVLGREKSLQRIRKELDKLRK